MLTFRLVVLSALLAASAGALAKPYCGELANAFGPFDYRTPDPDQLYLVEMAHFTEEVQQGVKGNTGTLGQDLDYTLRAFPNHTKALAALSRAALRQRTLQLPGARYAVECYFERAVRFQPDDGLAWGAYGQYVYALGENARALPMLKKAAELVPDNPAVNYNAGIAYFNAKNYELAVQHAKKAYQLGFPLPGLRKMLVDAGKWDGKYEVLPAKEAGEAPAAAR